MKVIVLNRKRLGVTIIIIGLMLILFGLEKNFDGRLKYVALMQSNINSLKLYEGLDKTFSYKLPSQWTTKEEKYEGNEVIYHNSFLSEDAVIHGMVQVWNINEDLKTFLDKSKALSEKYTAAQNYKANPITINKHEGYLVTYTTKTQGENVYRAYEYFIKDKNKFVRFSFFVREENFKENMPIIFKTIVETSNLKES
jgi:hypothetical protein